MIQTEVVPASFRNQGCYLDPVILTGLNADETRDHKIAEGGVVVVLAPFLNGINLPGKPLFVLQPCTGDPLPGEGIQIFVNKGPFFSVFLQILAGGVLMQQPVPVRLGDIALAVIPQEIAHGVEGLGGGKGPGGAVPETFVPVFFKKTRVSLRMRYLRFSQSERESLTV